MLTGRAVRRRIALGVIAASTALLFGGCAGKKKTMPGPASLTAEAAYGRGIELIAKHRLRQAKIALEGIQFEPESRAEIEPLTRLALADATFYQGTDLGLIDARNLYLDFVTLYGNHRLAPYAQLQAGFCSLKQVNHPSRDQGQTRQAIADLQEVQRRYGSSGYAEAARGLIRRARSNLAENEFLVGRFYLKRKHYLAAAERFRRVVDEYPDFLEMDKLLFHLGRALVLGNNDVEGRIYLDQIVKNYPEGHYAAPARKVLEVAGGSLEGLPN